MKQLLITLFLFVPFLPFSQTVSATDTLVAQYNRMLANFPDEAIGYFKTSCQLVKRAIGPVDYTLEFYFDAEEIMTETADDYKLTYETTLRKVVLKSITGSYNTLYTYYFNTHGALILYNAQFDEEIAETNSRSFYFNQDKCILIRKEKLDSQDIDSSTEKGTPPTYTPLTKNDKDIIQDIKSESVLFIELLAMNYQLFAAK